MHCMTTRALSVLSVKSIDEDQRIIRGIATTPEPDRVGDIIVPAGVQFRNPAPLLLQHRHDQVVGTVHFDAPTAKGITFEARLPFITQPGPLKDRVDEAWQSVKSGLLRAVSIGFRALDNAIEQLTTGGLKYLRVEVLELSLVSVPANASALITDIKSFDRGHRAKGELVPSSNTLSRLASIVLRKSLELEITSIDARQHVKMKLTRIEAQRLAEALLEYAGAPTKGYVQSGHCFAEGVMDLTDIPLQYRPASSKAVTVDPNRAARARGVVYLNRK
jgi:HK97 family phage prohead protease